MSEGRFSLKRIEPKLLHLAYFLALFATAPTLSLAQTFTVLHSFTGPPEGNSPYSTLVLDAQGNLYGTTELGGVYQRLSQALPGTAFKLAPDGTQTVLHSFGRFITPTRLSDGGILYAGVVRDSQGNLFGTTGYGPGSAYGVVFKLSPSGAETILHIFTGPPDGLGPGGGLVMDAQGNLYGTTELGGTGYCPGYYYPGCGTIYKVTPSGTETILHNFTGYPSDGTGPQGSLIFDAQGNLYGTTVYGGLYGWGTVFKLTPTGKETVLYNFGPPPDAETPEAGLVMDANGNLFGTTSWGGTEDYGTVFKLDPTGAETVLYSFKDGADGGTPYAGSLLLDATGNLYGTTCYGGTSRRGTIFELTPSGSETALYSFTGGADGGCPIGGLVSDSVGNFYGTASEGGIYQGDFVCTNFGCGTVFKLTP
jgi:uncharacterized repeat protein (TIGR03803 family)